MWPHEGKQVTLCLPALVLLDIGPVYTLWLSIYICILNFHYICISYQSGVYVLLPSLLPSTWSFTVWPFMCRKGKCCTCHSVLALHFVGKDTEAWEGKVTVTVEVLRDLILGPACSQPMVSTCHVPPYYTCLPFQRLFLKKFNYYCLLLFSILCYHMSASGKWFLCSLLWRICFWK